jgi:hypothetical protein
MTSGPSEPFMIGNSKLFSPTVRVALLSAIFKLHTLLPDMAGRPIGHISV